MIRLVTRGKFTQDYAKGLLAAPEDREPAVRKVVEGAGGKLVNFYFTTGDTDFLLVSEAEEAEIDHRRIAGRCCGGNDFGHLHFESLDRQGIQGSCRKGF